MLNLRLIRNEKNLGCGLSRQVAIDSSDADYLIPLDSDDMLLPMAISIFKQEALLNPEIDFFISHVINEVINEKEVNYPIIKDGYTLVSGKMYKAQFLKNYNIRNCEEFSRFADDTYINMLSYELGKTKIIPFPLYLYTCNPNSVTNTNGGKDYWNNVIPKFLRCIEETSKQICQYKKADEIEHLAGTLPYIKQVISQNGVQEETVLYNQLLDSLKQMGRTIDESNYL